MTDKTLVLGAVAYAPKVVTIWEGFKAYFAGHGLAFDYVLFSNYERQVEALFAATSTSRGTRRSRGSAPSASAARAGSRRRRSRCATPTAT